MDEPSLLELDDELLELDDELPYECRTLVEDEVALSLGSLKRSVELLELVVLIGWRCLLVTVFFFRVMVLAAARPNRTSDDRCIRTGCLHAGGRCEGLLIE